MRQSRNAKTWETYGPASAAHAVPAGAVRSKFAREQRGRHGTPRNDGLQLDGPAHRTACRWFPGFAELPAPFRATLDGYAPLFVAATGPLTLREREVIAHAVTGRDPSGFGTAVENAASVDGTASAAKDAAASHGADARERLIAAFAVKVTRRWLAIGGADVEQLLDAGLSAHAVRAIAEIAAVFHFVAEVSAAMLLRPRLAGVGRAPIAAVASKDPSWRELSRWLA